jgi:photosystem II stability/assembly factor-like uncharacterized protein
MSRLLPAWVALAAALVATPATPQPKPDSPLRPVLDGLRARCIGPANMGGRVVDLAVVESNPDVFYVAVATGGLWMTNDGGITLHPVFDDQPTLGIGAVAVCQGQPEVVYVGTGEGNPRNSASWGAGVFRSTDGGKSWTHCGLKDTHHIGRVVVHPTNPDVAYVAALGHFWGPNEERGLFKTTDGGRTWAASNFIDEDTGFVDVVMDPSDPETLYACAWEVRRGGFSGGNPATQTGKNGGLFKTADGGKTWAKMRDGLPLSGYGRCGVSVFRADPKVVYAVVQTDRTQANSNLGQPAKPDNDPETGGIFRSEDKGKTWTKLNNLVPRPFYYGQIRVDPESDQRLYVLGVRFHRSVDAGVTFTEAQLAGVHGDHHALWVNPKDPNHLILGNDGGLYVSKDRGKTFAARRGFAIGQFYGVAVDMRTPYRVYGGLQDNGSWGGPTATPYPDGITLADWRRVLGSDGFQCAVDPTDPDTVYAEAQYGGLSRIDLRLAAGQRGATKPMRPPSPKGGPAYRFNWNSPLLISPHDPKTVYYGGNVLFRSTNRGDSWAKISPDLTRVPAGERVTNSGHTLTTIAESPVTAGVLWAGTDDGKLWVSKNGGKAWTDLSKTVPDVPQERTISRVECSHFDADTAYLAIDRHRNDDFQPYLFLTTDAGKTWKPLANGLPSGAVVYCVRESSKNRDLLFAGTELGLYCSLDRGKSWHHLDKTGMPARVRVDDLVIHPRERDLVIGTHGRSIWVMDVAPLEQLTPKVLAADAHLFDVKPVTLLRREKRPEPKAKDLSIPKGAFAAVNTAQVEAPVAAFWVGSKEIRRVKFSWKEGGSEHTSEFPIDRPGLHYRVIGERFPPGEQTVTFEAGGVIQRRNVAVKLPGGEKKTDEK